MKRRIFGKKRKKGNQYIIIKDIYEKEIYEKKYNISVKFVSIQLYLLVFEYLKIVDN